MSNKGFTLPTGLKAGPVTIDAATGAIATSGNITARSWAGTNAPGAAAAASPNVKLLLNMNGTNGSTAITDSSLSAKTVTAYGTAQLSTSVKKYGTASAYFSGTGWIETATSSDFGVSTGSGDFTAEFWFYQTQSPTASWEGDANRGQAMIFYLQDTVAGYGGLIVSARKSDFYVGNARGWSLAFSASNNTWNHVAITRQNSTITVYVNGTQTGQTSNTVYGTPNKLVLGRWNNDPTVDWYFRGYIDDVRFINGQALYTSNFILPAAELTTTLGTPATPSNVKLLLNMNGSNGSTTFTDSSVYAHTVTANGNAQLNTSVKKYGTASAYFDGNGDYLSIPSSEDFNFGTGDFTVECWVNLSSVQGLDTVQNTDPDFFFISSTGSGGMFFGIKYYSPPGTVVNSIGYGRTAVAWDYKTPHGMTTNAWNHVAITRSGTSIRLFVNGTQVGSTQTSSQSYNLGLTSTTIGSQGTSYYMNGYIDDLRVVKGQALYTRNFTPSGSQLTTTPVAESSPVLLITKQSYSPMSTSGTFNFASGLGGGNVTFSGGTPFFNGGDTTSWGPHQLHNGTRSSYDWCNAAGVTQFGQWTFPQLVSLTTIFIVPRSQGDNFPSSVTLKMDGVTVGTYSTTSISQANGLGISYSGTGYYIQPNTTGTVLRLEFPAGNAYIGEIEFWGVLAGT